MNDDSDTPFSVSMVVQPGWLAVDVEEVDEDTELEVWVVVDLLVTDTEASEAMQLHAEVARLATLPVHAVEMKVGYAVGKGAVARVLQNAETSELLLMNARKQLSRLQPTATALDAQRLATARDKNWRRILDNVNGSGTIW